MAQRKAIRSSSSEYVPAAVTLSFDLPADEAVRLRALAESRGVTLADLLMEFATMALFDARLCGFATEPTRGGQANHARHAV